MAMPVPEINEGVDRAKLVEQTMRAGFTVDEARMIVDMALKGAQDALQKVADTAAQLAFLSNPMIEVQATLLALQFVEAISPIHRKVVMDIMHEFGVKIISDELPIKDGIDKR